MNDTYIIPILIAGSLLLTLFTFYITLFMIINKNKHRRFKMEKKEMEYRYQNELLNTRLEVQEQAINKVSQEIHDNIGQTLNIAQLNLSTLNIQHDLEEQKSLIENSRNLLAKAIDDLRNVSHVLSSENITRIGLEDAIKKELNYLSSFNKLKFDLQISGEPDELTDENELMVFRIAQEAIANIIKHANASSVTIDLQYETEHFIMTISDDGVGIENDKPGESSGIGIINMKQRAEVMKGSFEIESGKEGTRILIKIPYE